VTLVESMLGRVMVEVEVNGKDGVEVQVDVVG